MPKLRPPARGDLRTREVENFVDALPQGLWRDAVGSGSIRINVSFPAHLRGARHGMYDVIEMRATKVIEVRAGNVSDVT